MDDFAKRMRHYETKCRENLNRVQLSHALALETVRGQTHLAKYEELVAASFANIREEEKLTKVRSILHKLHLLSLKINFELFLNRLLSTVYLFHFEDLVPKLPGTNVSLKELAASVLEARESSADIREFIIDKIVGSHGLRHFEEVLKNATRIRMRDVLNRKQVSYWPQLYTAFEVRHLVEHRDGKIDKGFREAVTPVWSNSSWGKRLQLDGLGKVTVEEEDVKATLEAMLMATALLADEVLRWSIGQAV